MIENLTQRLSIRVTAEQLAWLEAQPNGVSAAIRRLIDERRDPASIALVEARRAAHAQLDRWRTEGHPRLPVLAWTEQRGRAEGAAIVAEWSHSGVKLLELDVAALYDNPPKGWDIDALEWLDNGGAALLLADGFPTAAVARDEAALDRIVSHYLESTQ